MVGDFKKAMILCAGLGTRLRPITEHTPKPMVPLLNVPNLCFQLAWLKSFGIQDFILNLHYLGEKIEAFLGDGSRFGIRVSYSYEKEILGTGGGLKKVAPWIGKERFVLCNADFVTDIDLLPVMKAHQAKRAMASMVLMKDKNKQKHYSSVGVDSNGFLCSLPKLTTQTPSETGFFTGIHLMESECLGYLTETFSSVNEKLYPALMKEKPNSALGHFVSGYWGDTGEPQYFFETSMELLELLKQKNPLIKSVLVDWGQRKEIKPGVWAASDFLIPKETKIHPDVILGNDVYLPDGASIGPKVILGDKITMGPKAHLENTIILSSGETLSKENGLVKLT
jgi:NDP-sugar pyrophosphorylase family protein